VAALLHAAGNTLNDRLDADVDTLARPLRPIPSGRVSVGACDTVYAVTTVTGLALAASLSIGLLLAAVTVVASSAAYSWRLKRTVLMGNAVVAALAGVTIPFGAAASGAVPTVAWGAGLLVGLYIAGFEVLKSLQDVATDAVFGIRTVATVLGVRVCHLLATLIFTAVVVGAAVGWRTDPGPDYKLAVLPLLLMVLAALSMLLVIRRAWSVTAALVVLKIGFLGGLPALALLG
jgi:geranylgeranylglycerol-phosphate geranylgeranyltransferase